MKKVIGLDSIRFVMAIIVVIGHFEMLNFSKEAIMHFKVFSHINAILNNSSPGVAAVIVFFIISGFCIHYPYANGKKMNIKEFYLRRIIRIGIPAAAALALFMFFDSYMVVFWSLICEVIYYLLYPFILRAKEKYMKQLLIVSVLICIGVSVYTDFILKEYSGGFHRNGYAITWIIGLPVWLLGVLLADEYVLNNNLKPVTYFKLWGLRFFIWLLAVGCSVIRFHASISYVYTLPLFSLVVYFWLKNEIVFYQNRKEIKWLEFGGIMSYSIYLVHDLIKILIFKYWSIKPSDHYYVWVGSIMLALIVSYLFYLLIEKPSHNLSRSIKLKSA